MKRKQKKVLILSDIHCRWKLADHIIEEEDPDLTICTGDYFDDFCDTPVLNFETAVWLKHKLATPNFIGLLGNHDLHYKASLKLVQCSGYSSAKYIAINDVMTDADWDKLKWFYVLDDVWLLSHAGLSYFHLPPDLRQQEEVALKDVTFFLDNEVQGANRSLQNARPNWLYNAGRSRGGVLPQGGILWCDFKQEFEPINGVFQIFGHTPVERPTLHSLDNVLLANEYVPNIADGTFNLDIDCHSHYYVLWDGKTLKIKPTDHYELIAKHF